MTTMTLSLRMRVPTMAPPGLPEVEATWEPIDTFRDAFPTFQLEDELFVEGGRDVMVGQVYQRRKRNRG